MFLSLHSYQSDQWGLVWTPCMRDALPVKLLTGRWEKATDESVCIGNAWRCVHTWGQQKVSAGARNVEHGGLAINSVKVNAKKGYKHPYLSKSLTTHLISLHSHWLSQKESIRLTNVESCTPPLSVICHWMMCSAPLKYCGATHV